MSDMAIQQVLARIREIGDMASGAGAAVAPAKKSEFADLLMKSLQSTNEAMKTSGDLQTRFLAGDETVSLSEAVIASEVAGIQVEAVVQVRNRLLSAYQEIMNMPI